ncbi:MAG: hypothetical protein K6T85_07740 [Gorillibacterium sp.]|nr:hypothetical protein [Gorillibacterium sp.]
MQLTLADLAPRITEEGKTISFAQFLVDNAGSTQLYDESIGEMLEAAKAPDVQWSEVENLICPIAYHLVSEAVQEADRSIYLDLVDSLMTAWGRLVQQKDRKDSLYEIDRESLDFPRQFDGLIHELASGRVIKEFEFQPSGCYRIVIGESNHEVAK